MKTVDIVYSGWVNAPNGASTFVRGMRDAREEFARQGIRLSVFSKDIFFPRTFDDKEGIAGHGRKKRFLASLVRHSALGTWLLMWRLFLHHAKFIVDKYLESDRPVPDIVYFHELFTCYYYLRRRKDRLSKVYLTLHNDGDLWRMTTLLFPKFGGCIFSAFRRKVERSVLSLVDAIGFVADTPRRLFCQQYPFPPERTFFVYNGIPDIPMPNRKTSEGQIKLVCVGTLCKRKNQAGILKSLSMLPSETQRQYHLTLVGDGEERKTLEELVKGLETEVVFTGSTSRVAECLRQADCFILFSLNEGLPISIIEAMRSGLPVISTTVAGIPELVEEGVNGYLVPPDAEALCRLLQKIAEERPGLRQMGEESRRLFEQKFTREQMIFSYSKVLQDK